MFTIPFSTSEKEAASVVWELICGSFSLVNLVFSSINWQIKNLNLISGSSRAQFLDTEVKIGSFSNLNCELLSVLCVLFGILLFLISRVLVKLLSQWHFDQGIKAGVEMGPWTGALKVLSLIILWWYHSILVYFQTCFSLTWMASSKPDELYHLWQ